MAIRVNREEINYNKIVLAVDSLSNMHSMSKNDFLQKIFVGAFKLIPEAEKGSSYELVDEDYIPIFSNGYDFETLKKLSFKREDSFIDYHCSDIAKIDAYEVYIEKRDESKYNEETINIFK